MEKATDPVCGMDVDLSRAIWKKDVGTRTFYFCSRVCRHTFLENLDEIIFLESMKVAKPGSRSGPGSIETDKEGYE
jgi:YHS domain-containing protein